MEALMRTGERVGRRRFLRDAGAAVAGAGLAVAAPGGVVAREPRGGGNPLPVPRPIRGGLPIGLPAPFDLIHLFLPGPENVVLPFSGLQLQGLDVEPSTVTNRRGRTAIAYLLGSARGSDGATYDLEVDLRLMKGRYRTGGSSHQGLFAMI